MIIREVEKPNIRDLIGLVNHQFWDRQKILKKDILNGIKIVGSGKGAIALVFKYLSERRVVKSKLDEVIMADWLGSWVYNQIQPFAFPAKKISNRTKVLFVYHQYGFPQDMDKILEFAHDKKLIVIEDCAHSIVSYYKGKLLGSFGDFTIYSFSKWFFCFALGGVKSKFDDFGGYADEAISKTPFGLTIVKDAAKFLHEWSTFSNSNIFQKYAGSLLGMSYAIYGEALKPGRLAQTLLAQKIAKEISVRKKRYHYFLKQTDGLGICDHLEREGITPYVIPIHCAERQTEDVIKYLRARGFETGAYHFDINRNLLNPQFIKTVWIPCHGGISDEVFSEIIGLVLKSFKK